MEQFYFISFDNTNHALQAESYLKKNNYNISVMPTPREVSQSCGLSIKFNELSAESIRDAIGSGNLKVKGIYCLSKEYGARRVDKVD